MYEDESVMYVLLYWYGDGFYLGMGVVVEVGKGGMNVNVVWLEKGLGDVDYLVAFDVVIEFVVKFFVLDLIIIVVGFDVVDGDLFGGMMVLFMGYMYMMKCLIEIGIGRVVVVFEGGYVFCLFVMCVMVMFWVLFGDELKFILLWFWLRKLSIKFCCEFASLFVEYWFVLESDEYKNSMVLIVKCVIVVGVVWEYFIGCCLKLFVNFFLFVFIVVGVVCMI